MRRDVRYFEGTGPEYTDECLAIVKELAGTTHKHIVVASTWGNTALKFAKELKNKSVNLVIVTHSAGFKEPNTQEFPNATKEKVEKLGGKVYTGTILTHSLEKALAGTFQGCYPTLLIAQVLRIFSQGVKVCCEIVMEACDGGLIPEGEEVIAVGGTGKGADTVCIIKSACSKRLFSLRVLEILAKPR